MSSTPPILFSTQSYAFLAAAVAAKGSFTLGDFERCEFPDGERYYRLLTPSLDRRAVLLGGTISDSATLELYDLAWALVESGVRSLALVIPYFGYSTMERAVKPGEVVMAKARTHLLSSIPHANCGNRVVLLDLHSEGLPYYFDASVRTAHLYAKPVIIEIARKLGGTDFVLASTDAGRAKWVESLANDLQVPAAFVYKRRLDGRTTEIAGISAQVAGKTVVIYDDMIRTGGSLLQAAKAYRDAGAKRVFAVATHGLFPEDSLVKIRTSNLLDGVTCTDSHPRACELADGFLKIESIAPLLAGYLRESLAE